jgi:hypothetical protein
VSVSLLALIIAGILVVIDIALGFVPNRPGRLGWLTPIAVLIVIVVLLVSTGGVKA